MLKDLLEIIVEPEVIEEFKTGNQLIEIDLKKKKRKFNRSW